MDDELLISGMSDTELDGIGDELSDDDLIGLGDYLTLDDYDLEGLEASGNPKKARKARAARKIKRLAKAKGTKAKRVHRRLVKRRIQRKSGFYGASGDNMICGKPVTCAGLVPIPQILYDTENLSTTQAAGDISYFTVIQGQTSSVNGTLNKAEYHTNMTSSKSLPNPQEFDLTGISWQVETATARALNDLRNKGSVVLYLGNHPYLTLPLSVIPMYAPLQGSFDGTTSSTPSQLAWVWGQRDTYDCRILDVESGILRPIHINRQETFWIRLKLNAALSMGADKDVRFQLHGVLYREVR